MTEMLNKEQLNDISRCLNISCNECSLDSICRDSYNFSITKVTESHIKAIEEIELLQAEANRLRRALLNLADYVLTGEYKKETLKILGLWEEEYK